ncbi:hypothetical protein BH24CHL9_BH24CHL9_07120 [soil metagenome]
MRPQRRSHAERLADAEARRARRSEVSDPQVVMEAAAAFLALRQRSVAETRRRLRHLGYPASLCDEVVGRLEGVGYLDDTAFARAWVESRDRVRPRGAAVLRQELRAKGVADETIGLILAERQAMTPSVPHAEGPGGSGPETEAGVGAAKTAGDVAAAQRLLARRRAALSREPDPRRRRERAYALLARNGFDPDVCASVVRQALAEPEDHGAGV